MSESITLFQFPKFRGLSSGSSFCIKLETYLRVRGLEYQVKALADPRKSPVGKLPYIQRGSETITDSDRIIKCLESEAGEAGLDHGLSELGHAQLHLIQRAVEEHLYWGLVYSLWLDPELAPAVVDERFAALNPVARTVLKHLIVKQIRGDLHSHGIGRNSRDDLYARCIEDIDALATVLGEQAYFSGDQIRSVDCAVFGVLEAAITSQHPSPLREAMLKHANLQAYHQRIRAAFWE